MQTISEIRALLDARGLKPKRKLGQNFLYDKNQLAKLIAAAEVKAGDVVLEVGPGTGTLTEALLEAGATVIACEIDNDMSDILEERLVLSGATDTSPCDMSVRGESVEKDTDIAEAPVSVVPGEDPPDSPDAGSFTLIRGDCLGRSRTLNPDITAAIAGREFKLIANLPYQIASPLMVALLVDHPNCLAQFITIQKEVADRLLASPSTKAYGPLTIITRAFAEVKKIAILKPTCFWPPPKVDSAMVALSPSPAGGGVRGGGCASNEEVLSTPDSRRAFARFITKLFTKRRKQLGTIFGRTPEKLALLPDGITAESRPETLTVDQHIELWRLQSGANARS